MEEENQEKLRNKKIVLYGICIILILCIAVVISYQNNSHTNSLSNQLNNEKSNKNQMENTTENSYYKKDNIISETISTSKDFGETMIKNLTSLGFTMEEATEIQSIFYKIGINSISSIQEGAGDGIDKLQSFVAIANYETNKKFYFTVEKRKMFYAGFMDETLYDTSKGGILKNINNVHIPETKVDMSTYTTLQVKAQEAVKQYLIYPNTASFPLYDGWGIARKDDEYKIYGNLTASNGFGVKDNMKFSVWFKKVNNEYSLEAIELDGTRVK